MPNIGDVVGIYTIIDKVKSNDNRIYKCECNFCHNIFYRSCGEMKRPSHCQHIGVADEVLTPTKWKNKRIGKIFRDMKRRCYDENDEAYRWYGAKGIKICNEWVKNPKSFEEWSMNNGYTDSMTIDRIDETKWYSPDNCRWITRNDNARYKSTTRVINVDGISLTGRDWAGKLGLGTNKINEYVRQYGIDVTAEFIKRVLENPEHKNDIKHGQSWFDLYMK